MSLLKRRSPCGALPLDANTTRFEVWAPGARSVVVEWVVFDEGNESIQSAHPLTQDAANKEDGIWQAEVECPAGTLYRISVDGQPGRPDPRSRFQPHGVHGPSQVIDPNAYQWNDGDWRGVAKSDLVIYEMHLGSFTQAGTYLAAIERLPQLVALGMTAIELLPLAQSPGRWNWGYDGVNYYAPRNTFGTPEELCQFVDACHQHGLAVINDVVYNHVGPEGNYLSCFGPYGSSKRGTPWGDAFNFDGEGRQQVRQFIIDNVKFWIEDFHFDGVRLDAVHYMFDDSDPPILDMIRDEFRSWQQEYDRQIYLIGETNIYDPHLVGDVDQQQPHHDGLWSDCIMHSIYAVADPELRLTNRHYQPGDLAEVLEHGYVFSTPNAVRVTPEMRQANHAGDSKRYLASLIMALQTHDSVGNHPHGTRLHQLTSVEFQKAAAPLVLLYPSIPMIFMGEEIATDCPFPFFADFEDQGLRKAVDKGRRDEYPHHAWDGSPLPSDPLAFTSSKMDAGRPEVFLWYQSLLALRRYGVNQGWIHYDRFRVTVDESRRIYELKLGERLKVVARLDQPDASAVPLDRSPAKLLLDSRSPSPINFEGRELPEQLSAQHCLIWLNEA